MITSPKFLEEWYGIEKLAASPPWIRDMDYLYGKALIFTENGNSEKS